MIRSKHSNLLNYFIHDRRDLSPAYVRSCEKFLKEISPKNGYKNFFWPTIPSRKQQAPSRKRHEKDTIK